MKEMESTQRKVSSRLKNAWEAFVASSRSANGQNKAGDPSLKVAWFLKDVKEDSVGAPLPLKVPIERSFHDEATMGDHVARVLLRGVAQALAWLVLLGCGLHPVSDRPMAVPDLPRN